MASLLYGAGLRLMECLALRVKDLMFPLGQLIVRHGKGGRDRVTMLPRSLVPDPEEHLRQVKTLHDLDLRAGFGRVALPFALERKFPKAGLTWAWQFVFPSKTMCIHPYTGQTVRHHCHPKTLQRAVSQAAREAELSRPVSCHTFRHCFATHLLEAGTDIRTLQTLLCHKDVSHDDLHARHAASRHRRLQSARSMKGPKPTCAMVGFGAAGTRHTGQCRRPLPA